jgi:molybdopterin synthase catalytic subunit
MQEVVVAVHRMGLLLLSQLMVVVVVGTDILVAAVPL